MSCVVVADRDGASRRAIASALRSAGYEVEAVREPSRTFQAVRRLRPVAVIVDPSGAEGVLAQLRCVSDAPVIVIAASNDSWEKVSALDAGADDYLAKPLALEELLARVRVALRRAKAAAPDQRPVMTDDFTIHIGDRRWLRPDGTEVKLTPTEWRLVEVLVDRAGHLVTQAEVLQRVWGPKAVAKPHYLRVQMAAIRAKVEPDPARPRYFITAPGLGLRFEPGERRDRGADALLSGSRHA